MTTYPINTEALAKRAGHILFTEGPEQPGATARETCVLLDALAAAEHRATRAEAQSETRRINGEYWQGVARGNAIVADVWKESAEEAEARIKAVRELHKRAWHGELDYCPRCVDYEGAIWPCPTVQALDSARRARGGTT